MRHIWKSGHLHQRLKMRLYVAAVCSVMTYGAEAWLLNEETRRALNGANSKMVSSITKRSVHDEARSEGKTYDVVAGVRAKRMRWLGQILQMDESRMLSQAVKTMYDNKRDGDLLMDAPETSNWEELRAMVKADKGKEWQQFVRQIKDVVHIQTAKEKEESSNKKRKGGKNQKTKKKRKRANDSEASSAAAAAPAATGRDDEEDDDSDEDEEWVIKRVVHKKVQPLIRCRDGFRVSIQASRDHYCEPRDDLGPYTHVEVAYPSMWEDLLLPYTDNNTDRTPVICGMAPTLYVNVPARVVREVIDKHGGMAEHSGRLPRMTEADEDGHLWAEPAVPPSTTDTEEESEEEGEGSPTSMAHIGAPPPPPPPTPNAYRVGALTPPQSLQDTGISPIER